jgi:hypothetical protein
VLRAYLRQRETLVSDASRSIQHMQKAPTEMNVQLADVISDISGDGPRIIDMIPAGERRPHALAELRDRRIRAREKEIARALEGHWKDEQLFILEQARLSYAHLLEQIAACDERLQHEDTGHWTADGPSGPLGDWHRRQRLAEPAFLRRGWG